MQVIENLKVKEKIFFEKLENGMPVIIIPKKGMRKKYMIWGTYYGSNDNIFVVPGEKEETKVATMVTTPVNSCVKPKSNPSANCSTSVMTLFTVSPCA